MRWRASRLGRFASLAAALIAAAASLAPAHAQDTKVFQFALQNGMQVVVVPDHRAPIVTQMLWYRVGAVDDPPGLGGLAHFFEHMMFRGTTTMPGDQFAQTVARNGGENNAFTTHDYTAFYEQIARDRAVCAGGAHRKLFSIGRDEQAVERLWRMTNDLKCAVACRNAV